MKSPYRVIVWGPGTIGSIALRQIAKKPELELAGVLAFNPEKNGKDVGEYLGLEPMGILMTTDQEKIINTPADVVLYCPHLSAEMKVDSEATDIACRILESGKNLITSASWWYPALHSQALHDRLQAACEKGGTSLHGTGVNPGWLLERVVSPMTGCCTEIDHIVVQEVVDLRDVESADMMHGLGFGADLSVKPIVEDMGYEGYTESLALTCNILGVKPDRLEQEVEYFTATKDVDLIPFTVRKGTRSGMKLSYHAIVNDRRFMTLQEIWYIEDESLEKGLVPGDYYTVTIEGSPVSVKCTFELLASAEKNLRFHEGDRNSPCWYTTAVTLIQTIPVVCEAKPGIVYPSNFVNFVPDLRNYRSPLIASQ